MTEPVIEVVGHESLSDEELNGLRRLFDAEYLVDLGDWDPEQPYGYAPHDVHVIARSAGQIIGHIGWQRRTIQVGDAEVTVAGVGGVLIAGNARGTGTGRALMARTATTMADAVGIRFGYLGCREEVVPFYASCGWHRLSVPERSIGRDGSLTHQEAGPPILVLPIESALDEWPEGPVDLRGRAW